MFEARARREWFSGALQLCYINDFYTKADLESSDEDNTGTEMDSKGSTRDPREEAADCLQGSVVANYLKGDIECIFILKKPLRIHCLIYYNTTIKGRKFSDHCTQFWLLSSYHSEVRCSGPMGSAHGCWDSGLSG